MEARIGRGYGRLVRQVLVEACDESDPAQVWRVAAAYGLSLDYVPLNVVFERLRFPVRHAGKPEIEWLYIPDLGGTSLRFSTAEDGSKSREEVILGDGRQFEIPHNLEEFYPGAEQGHVISLMEALLVASSFIAVDTTRVLTLRPAPQTADGLSLDDYRIGRRWNRARLARFEDLTDDAPIAAYAEGAVWNFNHPVVRHLEGTYRRDEGDLAPLDEFLRTLVWVWPSESRSALVGNTDWTRRSRWKLGRLHAAVEWSTVLPLLRPPYQVFVAGKGLEQLTESDFAIWNDGAP